MKVKILFGSQTGTAESIAKRFHNDCQARGIDGHLFCMKNFESVDFEEPSCLVLITSTTGNGDPPENAQKFFRFLKRKTPPCFSHLKYAVLGLGDTNYDKFCGASKLLDSKMADLGATRIHPRGDADDATGLEEVVEPWVEQVLAKLVAMSQPPSQPSAAESQQEESRTQAQSQAPSAPAPSPSGPKRLLVMYGSQTGTAESIAKQLATEAMIRGFKCDLASMKDYEKVTLGGSGEGSDVEPQYVAMVCSTTGNGDPPENAQKFFRHLKKMSGTPMVGVKFGVLGLGDTNYDKFCGAGKLLDKKLADLGATRMYQRGDADDATGLEEVVEPWIVGFLNALKTVQPQPQPVAVPPPAPTTSSTTIPLSPTKAPTSPSMAGRSPTPPKAPAIIGGALEPSKPTQTAPQAAQQETATGLALVTPCSIRVVFHEGPRPASPPPRRSRSDSPPVSPRPSRSPSPARNTSIYTRDEPYLARVLDAKRLSSEDNDKQFVHLALDLGDSDIKYAPGDAIGIVCTNDSNTIDKLLTRLNLDGSKVFSLVAVPPPPSLRHPALHHHHHLRSPSPSAAFSPPPLLTAHFRAPSKDDQSQAGQSSTFPTHIRTPCTVREAFLKYCDLQCTQKHILRLLAEYCSAPEERSRLLFWSSPQGQSDYRVCVLEQRANLLDILEQFPSCMPPLAHLFEALLPLQPRYYSIACSPLHHSNQVHITVARVQYTTPPPFNRKKEGICSTWLSRMVDHWQCSPNLRVPIFLRPSPEFHLPEDLSRPTIMIGPGTGVAPFRAFIQHRQEIMAAATQVYLKALAQRQLDIEGHFLESQFVEEGLLYVPGLGGYVQLSKPDLDDRVDGGDTSSESHSLVSFSQDSDVSSSPSPVTPSSSSSPFPRPPSMDHINHHDHHHQHNHATCRFCAMIPGGGKHYFGAPTRGSSHDQDSSSPVVVPKTSSFDSLVSLHATVTMPSATRKSSAVAKKKVPRAIDSLFGEAWLFYGCRHSTQDWLYKGEMEQWTRDGYLTHLKTAVSQEPDEGSWYGGAYVQDRLREYGKEIYTVMTRDNGCIFVCGDANSMARDVERILLSILQKEGKMTREKAMDVLAQWEEEQRYQKDIWK